MTDEQIMKHLYVLADFVYGETFSTNDKYEDVRCGGSLFRVYKKDNEVLNEVKNRLVGNPWHTGTPKEEGWYLICSPSWDMFPSKYNVAEFDGKDFVYAEGMHQIVVRTNPTTVAWQKIEPYKEKQDG